MASITGLDAEVLDYSIPAYFYESEFNPTAETLIVALTSHGGCGIHFEFVKPLKMYDKAHVLFLSSQYHNSWYIDGGLSPKYPTYGDVEQHILDPIIQGLGIKKLITLGEGAAGTGAIFYGWQMANKVDTSIITFAPYNRIPAANWDLVTDVINTQPNPAKLQSFYIYADDTYSPETDRVGALYGVSWAAGSKRVTSVNVEGAQHLAKAAFVNGRLYQYLDAELSVNDQKERVYEAITSDKYNSDRLTCHREEIENNTCDDILYDPNKA